MWSLRKINKLLVCQKVIRRSYYTPVIENTEGCSTPHSRGLVLGVYSNETDKFDDGILTQTASQYDERVTKGRLLHLLRMTPMPKRGEFRVFYDLDPFYPIIAVCGLGDKCLGYNEFEQIDEGKEAIRIAVGTGCKALQNLNTNKIFVENFGSAESSAEGAILSLWQYQNYREENNRISIPQVEMHAEESTENERNGWNIGIEKSSAQILTRELMEAPANHLTPTKFAKNVIEALCDSGVSVEVKVREWAESMGMHSFLAISKGSCEQPIFLELSYYGAKHDEKPIVLIGQGTTFNSGGLSLKSPLELTNRRGDVYGAACVAAVCKAVASMRLPVNIRALIPLCEHMIGAAAIKPGDIFKSINGKSIEIQDTANQSGLIMNDALIYAGKFDPKFIIDVGAFSNEADSVSGEACALGFTNSEELWNSTKFAGVHTGDRIWRMPLWNYFGDQLKTIGSRADLKNISGNQGGEACEIAAFLKEFAPKVPWLHDTSGVMTTDGQDIPYLKSGMSGRTTRTIIELIAQSTCHDFKI